MTPKPITPLRNSNSTKLERYDRTRVNISISMTQQIISQLNSPVPFVFLCGQRFYLIGSDRNKRFFRVLKIDRMEPSDLNISEDPVVYSPQEVKSLLQRIAEGNRATGGLTFVAKVYGIAGCIKFLESFYLILVTKRRQIGCICGHAIYRIDESQIISIPHVSVQTDVAHSKTEQRGKDMAQPCGSGVGRAKASRSAQNADLSAGQPLALAEQQRTPALILIRALHFGAGQPNDLSHSESFTYLWYKKLLSSVDLTKDFFYSYTYPIMQSLQKNVLSMGEEGMPYENIFVWNAFLTQEIRSRCKNTIWTIALVHGNFKQQFRCRSQPPRLSTQATLAKLPEIFVAGIWFKNQKNEEELTHAALPKTKKSEKVKGVGTCLVCKRKGRKERGNGVMVGLAMYGTG
ncbi:hypothetical protein RJ639_020433 [Escallonia herrerae]|uniref:SAC domain-containing protein n=1 Tax=Escallonia herrerae TaxID=1293975 RepID=A0AA88V481_9ASTE|nr:hypothetical protein RJ639_020433 [Escallonia herrerae]